ncbi:type VII secretion protein EccE, partial [Klenkia taihuensis]
APAGDAAADAATDAARAAGGQAQGAPVALADDRTQGAAVPALDSALPGSRPPERVRPGRPAPRRRPWTLGPFHLLQVVVWEAAAAVVLAVHRQPPAVLVPVAVLAGAAVLVTAVRVRGRWLHSWVALAARFRARRRRTPLTAGGAGPAPVVDALLDAVSPEARVQAVRFDDADAGLVVHRDGVAVVLSLAPTTEDPTTEPVRTLPPLTALLPPDESGDLPVAVQLLVQTVPAPGWTGDTDPAAVSYRELTGGQVPARRRSWVVLQVARLPEDDRVDDLVTTVANAVRRVRRQLERASLRSHLLGPDDLRAALLGVAGLDAGPDGVVRAVSGAAEPPEAVETWRSWRAGGVEHVTYRLVDWPSLDAAAGQDLVDRLGTAAGLQTTVSVAARRSGDRVELATALRVRVPAGTGADELAAVLSRTAADAGARVEPLHGRHRFGMAAALPLGGFLR